MTEKRLSQQGLIDVWKGVNGPPSAKDGRFVVKLIDAEALERFCGFGELEKHVISAGLVI
jgi:hypothetical protein